MFYLNKGLNCFCLFFHFMSFYFNNGINRQNDKEDTIYFHVLFKALKLFPVVGIIRLLPFWDFIRQQCQVHTNRSGHMELFCRVSSVSLFPMCKFPVFKDWIVESFGWIIFRDIPRIALMRLRSINVGVIFNTFLYIWKFLCIYERLNVLFDSLSSIELIDSHLFMVDYFDLYTVSNIFVLMSYSWDSDLVVSLTFSKIVFIAQNTRQTIIKSRV
jgi:hypothetical protein